MKTALIVEDNPGLTCLCRLALSLEGMRTCTAADGPKALEVMAVEDPDVVVIDLSAATVDEHDFMRELQRFDPRPPVLLIGSFDCQRAKEELGADGAISKPFRLEDFVEEVKSLAAA